MDKEGGYPYQIGLIFLLGYKSHMLCVVQGNITIVQKVLFQFDEITEKFKIFAAVVDYGYFSLDSGGH